MTNQQTIVNFSRIGARAYNWLRRGTGKDDNREVLQYIHTVDGRIESADDWQFQTVEHDGGTLITDPNPIAGQLQKINKNVPAAGGEAIVERPEHDATYPECAQLVPTEQPVFQIAVDPKKLINVLTGINSAAVRLAFYSETSPMEIYGHIEDSPRGESLNVYALLMPMHMGDNGGEEFMDWKPVKAEPIKIESEPEPEPEPEPKESIAKALNKARADINTRKLTELAHQATGINVMEDPRALDVYLDDLMFDRKIGMENSICMNPDCDYTAAYEPDCYDGWCEFCNRATVRSALVLAGIY